jgi:hypothetical protein
MNISILYVLNPVSANSVFLPKYSLHCAMRVKDEKVKKTEASFKVPLQGHLKYHLILEPKMIIHQFISQDSKSMQVSVTIKMADHNKNRGK